MATPAQIAARTVLYLANLGRGLRRSADGASIEAAVSADSTNVLGYSATDNGLTITKANIIAAALPAATAANAGQTVSVQSDGTFGLNPYSGLLSNWPLINGA